MQVYAKRWRGARCKPGCDYFLIFNSGRFHPPRMCERQTSYGRVDLGASPQLLADHTPP